MSRRSLRAKLACVALLALGAAGCGTVSAESAIVPAQDFADVFSADLAGDTNGLAWVVAGQLGARARRLDVRLYQRVRDGGWTRAPQLTHPLDPGGQPSLTMLAGVPCVGYPADKPVLACLREGRWRALPDAGLPSGPAQLARLTSLDGAPVAAFVSPAGPTSRMTVLRLDRARWHVLGRSLPTHGAIATLGEPTSGERVLDVALVDVPHRRRLLLTFNGGRWHPSTALEGAGAGPMPGGPVRIGSRVYLPVVDADVQPWRFSVYVLDDGRWTQLGPLNRGPGNAQGVVSASGGAVWATWQQHALRSDGRFGTRVYVQRVAPGAGPAQLVWQGVTIGPGSVDTLVGAGRPSVLYMPSAANGRKLTARVKPMR